MTVKREELFWRLLILYVFLHSLALLKGQNEVHMFLSQFMPEVRGLVGLSQLNRWNNFVDKQSLCLLRCCSLFSQYPEGLGKYDYIPGFAIRGLHYDVQKVSCTKFSLLGLVFHCVLVLVEMLSVTVYNNVDHQPISEIRSPSAYAFCSVGGSCLQTSQG